MKIYSEVFLKDFEFWAGAHTIADILTPEEFATIEQFMEMDGAISEHGWSETEVNDFFWFDGDTIAQLLGYDDEDSLLARDENLI